MDKNNSFATIEFLENQIKLSIAEVDAIVIRF